MSPATRRRCGKLDRPGRNARYLTNRTEGLRSQSVLSQSWPTDLPGLRLVAAVSSGERAFKGSHFERDVIPWAIRWYVAYPISYRQLEEMMEEHGVAVDHATLNRWVLKYGPLLRRRLILPRRNSTAGSSHDRVHRRSPRGTWGRADLQGPADRPVHLSRQCSQTGRSGEAVPPDKASTDLSIRQIQAKIGGRPSRGIIGEITKRARATQLPAL
jgi:hypothetical protein